MHPSPTIDSSPVTSSVSSATQEFLKTVDPGSDRKKRTPAPLNNEASGSATERPLAEIISEKFLPFDSATYILEPLQAVVEKDATVDEGVQAHIFTLCPLVSKHTDIPLLIIAYTTMLLDVILQTHAWATAPSKCKYDLECKKLEDQNSRILNTEQEQGMCSPTPLSSTSALSLSSSVSKFHYGIVGMLHLPSGCLSLSLRLVTCLSFLFETGKGSCFSSYFVDLSSLELRDELLMLTILVTLEKAREGLAVFVTKMKAALAALTGVDS